MTSTTLYSDSNYFSPYVMSAYVVLVEKNIPFTLETIDLAAGQHKHGDYAQRSLTSRVPSLQHADFILSESSAIIEYLEDIYPAPEYARVLPQDPQQRARARQIQAWLRSDLMPIREERPTTVIFDKPNPTPLSPAAQAAVARLFALADHLLADDATDLFGAWCIADTDLALMLNRLVSNGDAVPEKLQRYVRAQWQRPSVQQWVALSAR